MSIPRSAEHQVTVWQADHDTDKVMDVQWYGVYRGFGEERRKPGEEVGGGGGGGRGLTIETSFSILSKEKISTERKGS